MNWTFWDLTEGFRLTLTATWTCLPRSSLTSIQRFEESQIAKIFRAGEKFVEATKKEVPPGMIGLFALQGAVDKNLDFYVFDLSPRIPGCPCVEPSSPYMKYKYGHEVGPGRRVAMEIKKGTKEGRLGEMVT
jgi:5-formaminoimidazole-4-carboxamide-1-(beta)-D-ribofuranosyl 5'-monophosphate synthetase